MAETEKTLALHFANEDWDEATKERLREIAGDLGNNSASADRVLALATWLEQRSGPVAKSALWEIVKTIGAEEVVGLVRTAFGH